MFLINKLEQNIQSSKHHFFNNFINDLKNYLSRNNTENSILILDRFEGNFAICENKQTGKIVNIPKSLISSQAKDGDILKLKNNNYRVLPIETIFEKQKINKNFSSLFKK